MILLKIQPHAVIRLSNKLLFFSDNEEKHLIHPQRSDKHPFLGLAFKLEVWNIFIESIQATKTMQTTCSQQIIIHMTTQTTSYNKFVVSIFKSL